MTAVKLFKSDFFGSGLNGDKSGSPWLLFRLRQFMLLLIFFLEIVSILPLKEFLLFSDVASSLSIFSLSEGS